MAAEYRRPRSGRAPAVAKDRERAFARHRERIASRHSVKTADALVRMVDEEHLYYVAMNSGCVRLTGLGRSYWYLAKNGRI